MRCFCICDLLVVGRFVRLLCVLDAGRHQETMRVLYRCWSLGDSGSMICRCFMHFHGLTFRSARSAALRSSKHGSASSQHDNRTPKGTKQRTWARRQPPGQACGKMRCSRESPGRMFCLSEAGNTANAIQARMIPARRKPVFALPPGRRNACQKSQCFSVATVEPLRMLQQPDETPHNLQKQDM